MLRIVFLLAFAIFWASSFGVEEHSHDKYVTYTGLTQQSILFNNKIQTFLLKINQLRVYVDRRLQVKEQELNTKITGLQDTIQQLKRKLGTPEGSICFDRHTNWNDGAYKSTMHLDRHDVSCLSDEFLRSIKLERSGHNIRYKYKCCEISV